MRRRETVSLVSHYIAGVLDQLPMVAGIESLCISDTLRPGDHVQTLRGSTSGVITRILEDGRVAWRPDASTIELLALPETLRSNS